MWKHTEKLENLPQTRQEVAEPRTQLPDLKVSNRNRYNFQLLRQRVDEKTEYQRGKVTCQGCTANEWFRTTYPLGSSIKAAWLWQCWLSVFVRASGSQFLIVPYLDPLLDSAAVAHRDLWLFPHIQFHPQSTGFFQSRKFFGRMYLRPRRTFQKNFPTFQG